MSVTQRTFETPHISHLSRHIVEQNVQSNARIPESSWNRQNPAEPGRNPGRNKTCTYLRPEMQTRLALVFLTSAFAAADDGFNLVMLDSATFPKAKCLDGSQGGFYLRNGSPSTWLIELEGGGWCTSLEDCASRAKGAIGSSQHWPPSGCPGMDGGSNGMLSNDASKNPHFYNATAVHMNVRRPNRNLKKKKIRSPNILLPYAHLFFSTAMAPHSPQPPKTPPW